MNRDITDIIFTHALETFDLQDVAPLAVTSKETRMLFNRYACGFITQSLLSALDTIVVRGVWDVKSQFRAVITFKQGKRITFKLTITRDVVSLEDVLNGKWYYLGAYVRSPGDIDRMAKPLHGMLEQGVQGVRVKLPKTVNEVDHDLYNIVTRFVTAVNMKCVN